MRSRATRLWAGLVLMALLAGCTSSSDVLDEGPQDVLNEFVAAWNEEDFETMNSLMPDTPFRRKWHSGAMRVFFEDVLKDGHITDFQVTAEVKGEPTENSADTELEVVYDSQATNKPVIVGGNPPLERTDDGWTVGWTPGIALGGSGIDGLRVDERWPQRAAIFDRDGKRIAFGAAESRRYPFGSVAGTTVGHLEPPPRKGDQPDRLVGGSGLEAAYDEQLAGTPATKLKFVRNGKPVGSLGSKRGRRGAPLRTTLDMDVQRAAEAALGSTPGGAVVMDPATGDILAAVASSPFAPGNYVGVADIEPFNRALSGLYPPGSSLKAMTASAALDTGTVKPTTNLTGPKEYRGVRNFESGEFGTISFAAALQNSVNTAFAQVALKLGANRLFRYAEAFGFNEPPAMQLQAATSSFPKPLDEGDLMWGSIGQAQVLATPLQMASVAATIANDGRRMEPRIDAQLKPTGERAITVKTARTMHELMRNVVIGGTGVAANVTGLEVAGKTGTAEVDVGGERKNHAWFICFAPAPAAEGCDRGGGRIRGSGGRGGRPDRPQHPDEHLATPAESQGEEEQGMRACVQRATQGKVTIDDRVTGEIGQGVVVLLGISPEDGDAEARWLADKVANLRIFSDAEGKMNQSLLDVAGEALVVSQFTLYGDARKGRRPSFIRAAAGPEAERLYEATVGAFEALGVRTQTGEFGAMMEVSLTNDGPVTILLDSEKAF